MKKKRIILSIILSVFTTMLGGCANEKGQQAMPEPAQESSVSEESTLTDENMFSEESIASASPSVGSEGNAVIVTNGGAEIALSSLEHYTENEDAPTVYYLSDITSEALSCT